METITTQSGAATTPIPIAMLKRLAEAASGFRNRPAFWLVCRYKPAQGKRPYDFKFFGDGTAAAAERDRLNQEAGGTEPVYGAFGPFTAVGDPAPTYQVRAVTLQIERENSVIETVDLGEQLKKDGLWDGTGSIPCDALVWSLSALEKFMLPYYTYVEGIEGAQRVRNAFLDKGSFMSIHLPTTDYSGVDTKPEPFTESGAATVKFRGRTIHVVPV